MSFQTFSQVFLDSTSAYLIGQLEKLDPNAAEPMWKTTYRRDITLRGDISLADTSASFLVNNLIGGKDGYIAGNGSVVAESGVDQKHVVQPLFPWAKKAAWTVFEIERAMKLGQPIDVAKVQALQADWEMALDRAVYVGSNGQKGLLNNTDITSVTPVNGSWDTATDPDKILEDVNKLLTTVYTNTGLVACPTDLRLDQVTFGKLSSMKVSDAGNVSVLKYISENCVSAAENGRPLNIASLKWLTGGAGAVTKNSALAYSNDPRFLQFPVCLLQPQRPVFGDIHQSVTYAGNHGVTEVRMPETLALMTVHS